MGLVMVHICSCSREWRKWFFMFTFPRCQHFFLLFSSSLWVVHGRERREGWRRGEGRGGGGGKGDKVWWGEGERRAANSEVKWVWCCRNVFYFILSGKTFFVLFFYWMLQNVFRFFFIFGIAECFFFFFFFFSVSSCAAERLLVFVFGIVKIFFFKFSFSSCSVIFFFFIIGNAQQFFFP